jgi:aspartyl-tRNA(Asn)/glutamyl-tRNA(Gln) amidotransferase subunit C
MITKTDVEHIARLACIELDDNDLQEFTVQFNSILEYFEELEDIEAQLPKEEEERNVLRADEVTRSLTQQAALSNAPRVDSGYFRGPRIL